MDSKNSMDKLSLRMNSAKVEYEANLDKLTNQVMATEDLQLKATLAATLESLVDFMGVMAEALALKVAPVKFFDQGPWRAGMDPSSKHYVESMAMSEDFDDMRLYLNGNMSQEMYANYTTKLALFLNGGVEKPFKREFQSTDCNFTPNDNQE